MNIKKKFTFIILTYNHEAYIIEHLESIKFQIEKYGHNFSVKLVVSDDNSRDETIALVKRWLKENSGLFSSIDIIETEKNQGTCKNFVGTWEKIDSDWFKVLAGDDVYACANIFEFAKETEQFDFVSGMPLLLEDAKISSSAFMMFNMIATQEIYKNDFYRAMRCFSTINTPSLFYHRRILNLNDLSDFIRKYNVVEDFPMQIKVCELVKRLKYHLSNEIYVYYRRTGNSTYIIKNNMYLEDRRRQFEYLASGQKYFFNKALIRNRIACMQYKSSILRTITNLNLYIYLFDVLVNSVKILKRFKSIKIDVKKHKEHYFQIKRQADSFMKNI